jgi:hypothetical protein
LPCAAAAAAAGVAAGAAAAEAAAGAAAVEVAGRLCQLCLTALQHQQKQSNTGKEELQLLSCVV